MKNNGRNKKNEENMKLAKEEQIKSQESKSNTMN